MQTNKRVQLPSIVLSSLWFALSSHCAIAETPPPPASDAVKSLGGERYQVGSIVVDRKAGSFRLPARVHVVDKPLEYLLTTRGGMKEYETLLETEVSGTEFNLACILLGLERDPNLAPFYQFGQAKLTGQVVDIALEWTVGKDQRRVTALEALLDSGASSGEPVEWIYVGSNLRQDNKQFAADITGTLIGFVHDSNSVIEASSGIGIGAYGSVNGNTENLPALGADLDVIITVRRK